MEENHWSALSRALSPHKIDLRILDELRRFVDLPELRSFAVTASNLLDVLPRVKDIEELDPRPDRELIAMIPHWIRYCELMVSNQAEIEVLIPGFSDRGDDMDTPPLRGNFKTHPLGVALWCRVATPGLASRYQLLQAYLGIALHHLRPLEEKKHYRFVAAKINACRASRQLAKPRSHGTLGVLPDKPLPFGAYFKALESLEGYEFIKLFVILFDYALKGKKGITRKVKHRARKPADFFRTNPLEEKQRLDFTPEESNVGEAERVRVFGYKGTSDETLHKQAQAGCASEEFNASEEKMMFEYGGRDPSGGLSFGQQKLRLRQAAAAIAMSNQRLSCDWERLTPHEVTAFLKEVSSLARSSVLYSGIPAVELAAFLSAVFWSSSTIQRMCDCRLVTRGEAPKEKFRFMARPGEKMLWVVTPPVPPIKRALSEAVRQQTVMTVTSLALEVPLHAAQIVGRYLVSDAFVGKSSQPRLFPRPDSFYEKAAEEFLGAVRRRCGGRQTLQRVSIYLHDALSRARGSDITLAMAVSGRQDILGLVPLHYTALPISRIQEVYGKQCDEIATGAGVPIAQSKIQLQISTQRDPHVGSQLVPAGQVIIRLVRELRDRMSSARSRAEDNERELKRLHNILTVYTIMLVGFATGYRAVTDPLLQKAEIDRETGFAVISDKDGDDLYNSRIVWLPPVCVEQLAYYQEHLTVLQYYLFNLNQDLFFTVRRKVVSGRRPIRESPSLMYLKGDNTNLPLQPRFLASLVGRINYRLPVNSNRHFLRTNLIARGCSIEVVNAFMGHWERGLEPWGSHSGLSPLDYRNELHRCLVPLLEDFGWTAERGLVELP